MNFPLYAFHTGKTRSHHVWFSTSIKCSKIVLLLNWKAQSLKHFTENSFESFLCLYKGQLQTTCKALLPLFLSAADPAVWCELSPGSPYWWGTRYLLKASPVEVKQQEQGISHKVTTSTDRSSSKPSVYRATRTTAWHQLWAAILWRIVWWPAETAKRLWARLVAQPLRTRGNSVSWVPVTQESPSLRWGTWHFGTLDLQKGVISY